MTERIADPGGALWPVTGHRCAVCRWPLDATLAEAGVDTHPSCYEEDEQ